MISDYAMPQQSGTEFLREARNFCPDVPALIITGYAEADAISDRPEGVEILLKPFTPTKLEAALSRVCECGACDPLTTVPSASARRAETATSCETRTLSNGCRGGPSHRFSEGEPCPTTKRRPTRTSTRSIQA